MHALVCERHGLPETLVWREIETPQPGAGEIRLRVHAAGVNFPDALIIQNLYQTKPALPFSPGGEAAGIVDAVGAGVTEFQIGDRVAAMTTYGAFADQVIVSAARCVPVPASMSLDIAAGFTMVYGTALHALKQRGNVQAGETLLILGAAGGVGLAAVEVGKAMGARVIAAASSAEKLALAQAHGADALIDYRETGLKDAIKDATDGRGADVIYDPVGGDFSEQAFRAIARNGRHLVIGFAAGTIPKIPLNLPLIKDAAIIGVLWGSFFARQQVANLANVAQLYDWHAQGLLRPHVGRRYPMARGAEAIRWIMDGKALGKVVLTAEPG